MRRHGRALAGLVAFLLVGAGAALAQSGGGFDLSWNRIAGGGGGGTSPNYSVTGIIGQSAAGVMSGPTYSIEGGFMVALQPAPTATGTATPTATATSTATATATSSGTPTPTATATGTFLPTGTPTVTPTPGATPCILGDINCDGIVDLRDYAVWRQQFGATNCGNVADLNHDCLVDIRDYGIWRANFGHTAGGAAMSRPLLSAPPPSLARPRRR
jgi:hypothetical protein